MRVSRGVDHRRQPRDTSGWWLLSCRAVTSFGSATRPRADRRYEAGPRAKPPADWCPVLERAATACRGAVAHRHQNDDRRHPDKHAEHGRANGAQSVCRDTSQGDADGVEADHAASIPTVAMAPGQVSGLWASATIRPSRISTTRSAMDGHVVLVGDHNHRAALAVQAAETPSTGAEATVSRFPVGSSARTMAGSFTTARATATRCCSPPESSAGGATARRARPTRARA